MSFGASEINKKEFTVAFLRGYRMSDVDDFLDLVAGEVDKLQRENESLKKRVAELEKQHPDEFSPATASELTDLAK